MPADPRARVGQRIAAARRTRRMTQADLALAAGVSYSTVRAVERGGRLPSDSVLDALAAALDVDPSRLVAERGPADSRVRDALPRISAALAAYDVPGDGPVRNLDQLRPLVHETVNWRLGSQYARISRTAPDLLDELSRALAAAPASGRPEAARLLIAVARSADAVAYKYGARDLSARLIDLMRWAAPQAEAPLQEATVAYVRTEVFFAAHAYASGLLALEKALDSAPAPVGRGGRAARCALHMRAAVIAARAGYADAAETHLDEARQLADGIPEGVYHGTAVGPDSVRIHEVSVAVSLGRDHLGRALDVGQEWKPPRGMPAERRSGFYIELARAQLWAGRPDDAFESLKVARKIAPQHTREHRWVRQDVATIRRLKRSDAETLSAFTEWCHAI